MAIKKCSTLLLITLKNTQISEIFSIFPPPSTIKSFLDEKVKSECKCMIFIPPHSPYPQIKVYLIKYDKLEYECKVFEENLKCCLTYHITVVAY